ncbi:T9SS type A sorting domain-containing protein, partial [bacterium]|nr:T9SS type A sorting domain-containing protein [bacterium]
MKHANLIFSFVVLLVLAGGLWADWTDPIVIWDESNWFERQGAAVYMDSAGNCIAFSGGFWDSSRDTAYTYAFVYDQTTVRFDTIGPILSLPEDHGRMFRYPEVFNNLVKSTGEIVFPLYIMNEGGFIISYDGVSFDVDRISMPFDSSSLFMVYVFPCVRDDDRLSVLFKVNFMGTDTFFIYPDISVPDTVIKIGFPPWHDAYVRDFFWIADRFYLSYIYPVTSDSITRRLSEFADATERVLWSIPNVGNVQSNISREDLSLYCYEMFNLDTPDTTWYFWKIDSTGSIDTLYTYPHAPWRSCGFISLKSRELANPIGLIVKNSSESFYLVLWFDSTELDVDTLEIEPRLWGQYNCMETTPGTYMHAFLNSIPDTAAPTGYWNYDVVRIYNDTIVNTISENDGIHFIKKEHINIYPNPFNITCQIRTSPLVLNIAIYDITGRIIDRAKREDNTMLWPSIELGEHSMNSGIYFAIAKDKAGNILDTKKVVLIK